MENSKLPENKIENISEAMILVKQTTKKNITINEDMNLDGFHQEEHLILGIKILSLVTVWFGQKAKNCRTYDENTSARNKGGFYRRPKIAKPMTIILQEETKVWVSVRFNVIIFIFQKTVRGSGILKCGEEKYTSCQGGDNRMPKQANEQVSNLLNKKDVFFT